MEIKAGTLEEIFDAISETTKVQKMEALSEAGIQIFEKLIQRTFKQRMGVVLILIDVPEKEGKVNLLTTTNLPSRRLLCKALQEVLVTPTEGDETSSVN